MVDTPDSLRKQARSIAAGSRPAEAWSELRMWASGKGPLAMKSAMIEFISAHGRSPEAALLMPRIMRDKSLSPAERKEMLSLGFRSELDPQHPLVKPRFEGPKSAFMLSPQPRPSLGHDPADPRQMHLAMRENAIPSLKLPAPGLRFDASKSPDSHVFSAASHKGERLIHNLVERMRGHAQEHPVQGMSGPMESPRARPKERKPARKRAKRAPRKGAKKAPKARKRKTRRK